MSPDIQSLLAEQLHQLYESQSSPFAVVLHGGEPLLLGADGLTGLFAKLRRVLPRYCSLNIQTNGVLIDTDILDVCAQYEVSLSVSLDGPEHVHDKNRVDLRGRPSHALVVDGIERLREHKNASEIFSGVLAVVDPSSDPSDVYCYLKSTGAPSVDFLVRDGNLSKLPVGKATVGSVEYGEWLCRVLDAYIADPTPPRVRLFDDLIKLTLGASGCKEGVGVTDFGILVIDTDGSISKNDTLKSTTTGDRFAGDWNVSQSSLCEIVRSEEFRRYHAMQRPSSELCKSCSKVEVCGGGMLTHRFDGDGFDNPTVYCADQKILMSRIDYYLKQLLRRRMAA